MRKILFIPLLLILIAVLFFGRTYANKPMYTDEEIMSYNDDLVQEAEEKTQEELDAAEKLKESQPPVIQAVYPQSLEDGGQVEADRVYLQFLSGNEIISVTANGMDVSSHEEVTITTSGTYEIVVTDEFANEVSFTFTLIK